MNSLYDDPGYAEVRQMMHEKLEEVRMFYGDSDENNEKFIQEYLDFLGERNKNRSQ